MTIKFKCNEIVFIPINQLKEHPKNKLIHPDKEELVDRLCKIIKSKQGFTSPVKIDRNSKVISCGHARLQALKKLGCKEAPCIPIDYENEDYLLADLIADNAANEWREVNKSAVNAILPEIGDIDFDIDVLGIENFEIEPMDKIKEEIKDDGEPEFLVVVQCENEHAQQEVFEDLTNKGFVCKIMS
jgi:hypothetical protein